MKDDDIKIRPAIAADTDRIAELCVQLGYKASSEDVRERLRRIMEKEDTVAFVAEEQGFVTGWIQASVRMTIESGDSPEITGLVVDESARGKGIGSRLVRQAEDWAKDIGHRSIRVRTNVLRAKTHDFYRRLGFEESKKQTVFRKVLR